MFLWPNVNVLTSMGSIPKQCNHRKHRFAPDLVQEQLCHSVQVLRKRHRKWSCLLFPFVCLRVRDTPKWGSLRPFTPFPYSIGIQSPCQMMIGVYNLYNHLRNARYLGSMKPFSEGEPGSLGKVLFGICFTPKLLGKWSNFDLRIFFKMGWNLLVCESYLLVCEIAKKPLPM